MLINEQSQLSYGHDVLARQKVKLPQGAFAALVSFAYNSAPRTRPFALLLRKDDDAGCAGNNVQEKAVTGLARQYKPARLF